MRNEESLFARLSAKISTHEPIDGLTVSKSIVSDNGFQKTLFSATFGRLEVVADSIQDVYNEFVSQLNDNYNE